MPERVWIQKDPMSALWLATTETMATIKVTIHMIGRLLSGHAGLDQLAGPLRVADFAGRTAQMGLGVYLGYLAMLSVSIGVFNLLPVPVLDGGHLLYYLYEFVTGKSPSEYWLSLMQRLGLALLLTLMMFTLLNDFTHLG
jgi:regulator of sigma E protease